MPQTLNPLLKARLAIGATTLCTLVKITRTDGVELRYTSSTRNKTFNSLVYKAGGFEPTDILLAFDNGPGSLALVIAFDDDITQTDVRLGKYYGALITVEWGDWLFPEYGTLPRFSGVITSTSVTNEGAASFSCSGQIYQTLKPLGEIRTATCRAQFGDERCKFAVTDFLRSATVTAVDANYITVDIVDIAAADPQDAGDQAVWQVTLTGPNPSIRITQLEMRAAVSGISYTPADGAVYDNKVPSPDPADPWNNDQWTGGSPAILGIELSVDGPVKEFAIRCPDSSMAPTSVKLSYAATTAGPFTDALGYTFTGLVWSNTEIKTFSRTVAELLVSYQDGLLLFTSGENQDLIYDIIEVVQNVSDTTIRLAVQPTRIVNVGDTVEIYPGCDKTLLRCKYYANVVNFRGEPYVPTDTYQGQNPLI